VTSARDKFICHSAIKYHVTLYNRESIDHSARRSICAIKFAQVSLRNKIEMVGNVNERQTRQMGNVVMGFGKSSNVRKSVFYEAVKMYNSLSLIR